MAPTGQCSRRQRTALCLAESVPENLRLADQGIPVSVSHAEYLGADTVLACKAGDVTLLARLPGRVVPADGTRVHLVTDEPIHLFDAATSQRSADNVAAKEAVGA